jgi:hypothetical protein
MWLPLHPPKDDRDPLLVREELHREALSTEHAAVWARGALQCARNFASIEVTPIGGEIPRGRFAVRELLVDHPRVLVVGGEGAGKSTLAAHLALHEELPAAATAPLPFVLAVELLRPHERLEVSTIARLAPAAGAPLVERALADHRALIIVDGLDRAPGGPAALLESIPDFARAHPGNRFVITTRPLTKSVLGHRRLELPGFLTTAILPPLPPSRVLPAYRFVGLRSPERKTALYLERVDALLLAWEPAAVGPGSPLGRITPRDLRKLVAMIAWQMHKRCDFEIELGLLTENIARALWCSDDNARLHVQIPSDGFRGKRVRRAPELAPAIVGELRARPALLVERRPSRFAFADFVLQEVLTAVRMEQMLGTTAFVESRHDRWWHGVIELAAGLPQLDSAELVSALLEADQSNAADVSVLAARCAETAPELPERIRRVIARRFNALVPPEHLLAAERLFEIGDIAASAVLRAMRGANPTERALSALVLGRLQHEPACGALIALASDTAVIGDAVAWPVGGSELDLGGKPVATCALAGLLSLAQVSGMGRKAFGRGLARAPRESVQYLYNHLERKRLDVYLGELDPDRDAGLMAELQEQVYASLARWRRGDRLHPR